MTMDLPTWLSGPLVVTWIARVGHGPPAEQPHITGSGQIQGLVRVMLMAGTLYPVQMRWPKALGLDAFVGVAVTGVVIARAERRRQVGSGEVRDGCAPGSSKHPDQPYRA